MTSMLLRQKGHTIYLHELSKSVMQNSLGLLGSIAGNGFLLLPQITSRPIERIVPWWMQAELQRT